MKPEAEGAGETLPPTPASAVAVFGDQLALAERYIAHLGTTGVTHGLIGPREVSRLWERHVLNCAVLTELLPEGAAIVDIGSGAGLPGLTLAIRRPDLKVTLVEPLLRRVVWLTDVLAELEIGDRVEVRRARAEEVAGEVVVPFVTARAVAPLDRLATWGLPLLQPNGIDGDQGSLGSRGGGRRCPTAPADRLHRLRRPVGRRPARGADGRRPAGPGWRPAARPGRTHFGTSATTPGAPSPIVTAMGGSSR